MAGSTCWLTSVAAQPILPAAARVRALEEKLPGVERHVKRHLPHGDLPSKAVGQVRAEACQTAQRGACCGAG